MSGDSMCEWENDGHSLGVSVCMPVVSSLVTAVHVVPVVPVAPFGCECDR